MTPTTIYEDKSIRITRETISVGRKTYFVSTASSVSVVHSPAQPTFGTFIHFISAFIAGGIASTTLATPKTEVFGAGLIVVAALFFITGLRSIKKETYHLALAMSSGETNVLSSRDGFYIQELKSHVETAFRENANSRADTAAPEPAPFPGDGDHKICPMCAETVKAAALKCRFCGHDFGAVIEG